MSLLGRIRAAVGRLGASIPAPPRPFKGAGTTVRRTICCFCSCGCGMLAFTRDGHLVGLEGDPGNPINEGTLCCKGAAAAELHRSPERLTRPLRRAPGGTQWEPIAWNEALKRVSASFLRLRARSWDAAARRTDAIAFVGGAVNTNEEAYLYKKLATLLGTYNVENQARI